MEIKGEVHAGKQAEKDVQSELSQERAGGREDWQVIARDRAAQFEHSRKRRGKAGSQTW